MSTITEKLKWLIDADATSAVKGFTAAGDAAEKNLKKAETSSQKLGGQLTKVGAGAVAVAGIVGGALVKAAGSFEDLALKAGRGADATGLTVDQSSRWIEVSGDMGIGFDVVEGAIGKMNKTLGMSPAKFEELGIKIATTKGGVEDVNGTFLNTIDRLNQIEDPAARAAAAAGIFGKGWQGAAELLHMSTDDIRTQLQSVSDQKVINDEELQKAKDYRADLDHLKDSAEDLMLAIGQGAAPVIGAIASVVGTAVDAFASLDAVSGGAAGGILAAGAAALGVIGSFSLVAGQALKLKDRLTQVGVDGSRSLTGFGKVTVGVASVVGLAMFAIADHAANISARLAEVGKSAGDLATVADDKIAGVLAHALLIGTLAGQDLDGTMKALAETNLDGAKRALDLGAANGLNEKQTIALRQAILDQDAAAAQAATTTGTYATATEDATSFSDLMTAAQLVEKTAIDNVKKATDDAATATAKYKDMSDAWADSVKADIDQVQAEWDQLTGDINDDKTWLNLQTSFDELKPKIVDAWKAAADGADDAEQKTRDAQVAVDDQKLAVIEYGKEVLGLPPEKLTNVLALIDQGSFDAAEEALRILTRDRGAGIFTDVHPSAPGHSVKVGAKGGIIPATPGGQLIIAGEAGTPEALVPLDGQHSLPGGGPQIGEVHIHVQNMPSENEMMRLLATYRRRNGPGAFVGLSS